MLQLTRNDIIAKAREYLNTPFGHQGRRKGQAVDCVGLVLCVMQELDVTSKDGKTKLTGKLYDSYSGQPAGDYVHQQCRKHLVEKSKTAIKAGDIITLCCLSLPCHVAIVANDAHGNLTMIHSYNGAPKRCIEHLINSTWKRRIAGVFEIPGVSDNG